MTSNVDGFAVVSNRYLCLWCFCVINAPIKRAIDIYTIFFYFIYSQRSMYSSWFAEKALYFLALRDGQCIEIRVVMRLNDVQK